MLPRLDAKVQLVEDGDVGRAVLNGEGDLSLSMGMGEILSKDVWVHNPSPLSLTKENTGAFKIAKIAIKQSTKEENMFHAKLTSHS